MNLLFSCIGRRGYIADYFRPHLKPGEKILGTSNSSWTAGFTHCDVSVVMPDIADPRYCEVLVEVCKDYDITAVFSFFDQDVFVLSKSRDVFVQEGIIPVFPAHKASEICFDKKLTSIVLSENNYQVPATFDTYEGARIALSEQRISFPLIVKPRFGFASKSIFMAKNEEELSVFFRYAPNMLIQELLRGQEYHLDACVGLNGDVLDVVAKRKVSMRAGETDQCEITDSSVLVEIGTRLSKTLSRFGHVGPLDIDVFIDNEIPYVLELNPRFGGGYPMSHLAGADFPGLLVSLIRGETDRVTKTQIIPGFVCMKEYNVVGGRTLGFIGTVIDKRTGEK